MKPCSGKSRIIPRIMYAYQRLLLGGRDKHVLSFYCLLVNTTLHARPERKFLKAVHKSPHATLGGTRGYSNNAFSMPCKILELTDSGSKRWLASIPSLIVYLSDRLLILSECQGCGQNSVQEPILVQLFAVDCAAPFLNSSTGRPLLQSSDLVLGLPQR